MLQCQRVATRDSLLVVVEEEVLGPQHFQRSVSRVIAGRALLSRERDVGCAPRQTRVRRRRALLGRVRERAREAVHGILIIELGVSVGFEV